MVEENPGQRYCIDDIISNPDIKKLRLRQVKNFLKDYSNSIFNLKTNRNILDKIKDTVAKADKRICGLIFHVFNSGKNYMMDHPMVIKINVLFDFLDINSNNFVTTDEFRDKLIELLIDNEDEQKFKENKEIVKEYAERFREIIDLIMDNDYFKMNNIDSNQFNFNTFYVVSMIIWFLEEKERTNMKKKLEQLNLNTNQKAFLEKSNNNTALNKTDNNQNFNNSKNKNENINTPNQNIINKSLAIKNPELNNRSLNNQSKSNFKEKTFNNGNALNEKRMNYGRNFDIYNPECLSISNEKKITNFVNAYFNTKHLIAFDKLIFDKRKFDIKVFSQIESYLIEKYMNKDFNIFEIDNDEKKYYMTKENFLRFLEYEFV